ncbi:ExeM/NucH family extracellular endonuclease [Vibrio genomosp. F6]|uniref:Endonuclease/exonuclease/phosphatase n=1 Tax=Vibrio genomosp. F6 str. FF-238 TaxID=1191298 RepID=A0A1E5D2D0_9VIBR|nr:ExeM/NucH family extracellular endonuclease [Vibrio genomosp. F6]OEE77653.1 endonuclease/exonuclease/phosphatase [Vibrio genomosp. F6 str. FF-238]
MKKSLIALSVGAVLSTGVQANVMITEYVEGGASNKAIELYNSGTDAIDLSGYSLVRYKDGASEPSQMVALSGTTINAKEVIVVRNNATDTPLPSGVKQITNGQMVHNGGDAVALLNGSAVVDVVGDVPTTSGWGKDKTLRRLSGSATDVFVASDWETLAKNTIDGLGYVDGSTPPKPDPEPTPDPDPTTTIMDLQGDSWASPHTDPAKGIYISSEEFTVAGIITAIQTEPLDGDLPVGFFIQDENGDGDVKTSDGIFVVGDITGLNLGDKVEVTGPVEEKYGWTQIPATKIETTGTGSITPTIIKTQYADPDFDFTLERHEGMLVELSQAFNMQVARSYSLDDGPKRFNMLLAHEDLNQHPNQKFVPATDDAKKQADCSEDKRLVVESFAKNTSSVPSWFPTFGATDSDGDGSADDYIRVADTVDGLQGVIGYSYSDYRFYVTNVVDETAFVRSEEGERQVAPSLEDGDIRVASFNTQGYFNSLQGGGETNPYLADGLTPGAQSAAEFETQTAKLVSALKALDADIIGLMEIENNGFGDSSAIVHLVKQLNAELPEADHYSIASSEGLTDIGSLATSNQVIFRANTVGLDSLSVMPMPEQRALATDEIYRQHAALVPTFTFKDREEKLTVAVNQFKGKDTPCLEDSATDEQLVDLDRQGSCENLRVSAADYLGLQLADIDGEKIILGSLNAYASEDPILVLTNRDNAPEDYSITAASNTFIGDTALHGEKGAVITASYGYENVLNILKPKSYNVIANDEVGSLDYVLTSAGLKSKVVDATQWNINAGESSLFGFANSGLATQYTDSYRSAEHDPVVLSIAFDGKPIKPVDPIYPENPDQPIIPGTPVKLPPEPINEPRPSTPSAGQSFDYFVDLTATSGYLKVGDEVTVSVSDADANVVVMSSYVAKDTLDAFEIALGWTEVTFANGFNAGDYQVITAVDNTVLETKTLTVAKSSSSSGGSAGLGGLFAMFGLGFLRRKFQK